MVTSAYMPDFRVEVAFNAGVRTPVASRTWTDVSDYVELQDSINITRGRDGELSTTSPATMSLTLNNSDGRFTPGVASSPYYPNVKLGRPIRVLARLLDGSFEAGITGWVGANATLAAVGTPVQSGGGALRATASSTATVTVTHGATTADGVTVGPGARFHFSAYVQRAAGVTRTANLRALWYDSSNTLLADVAVNTFSLTAAGTYVLLEGTADAPAGAAHVRAQVQIISPAASQVFYIDEVRVDSPRFTGFVDEWPVEWRQGVDANAEAPLTATGRMARLGEGAELRSIIETEIVADDPVQYYALTEPEGSLFARDLAGTDQVGMYSYYGGTDITFGTGIGVATDNASAPRIESRLDTDRPTQLAAHLSNHAMTECTLEVFASVSGNGGSPDLRLLELFWGDGDLVADYRRIQLYTIRISGISAAYAMSKQQIGGVYSDQIAGDFIDADFWGGTLCHFALTYQHDDTNPVINLYVNGALVATETAFTSGSSFLPTLPDTWLIWAGDTKVISGDDLTTLSHIAVYDQILTADRIAAHAAAGLDGFDGELAAERIERYAGYASVEASEVVSDAGVVPLSHIDSTDQTPESLLRTVETTENGVLFDGRDGTLNFHDRDHRYQAVSALTLDAALQHIEADGLRPVLDRALLINEVTAVSTNGMFERRYVDTAAADETGARRLDIEVATSDESEVYSSAAWRVNKYKDPKPRIAALAPVDVLPLDTALRSAIRDADISTKFTVSGLPAQAPAASQNFFIEGVTETIGPESWQFQFNVSAAETWDDVWVLDSATHSQLDSTTILAL